ncbi:hypothetical protein [uncultured Clostridium sp.]|uniref:hypothetical protein n=1 Tax=uncultured Clostridium sp. TaxID=59620 RepID=UPI0026F3E489|nr:hypothetical protein [uncultured Clostridium sp.]
MRNYLEEKQNTYKKSIEKFNRLIKDLNNLNHEHIYIKDTKVKLEDDIQFLGIDTLEDEILNNYVEINNIEENIKLKISEKQDDIYLTMLDILNNKIYLALVVYNKMRLWELISINIVFVNLIICILLKSYLGNLGILVWILLDLCECIPLYCIAKYKFNSFKKELIKCIDMCKQYKEK